MTPKFRNLEIDDFRLFRHLRIEGLGQVNLITGRNNTGKSAVLEALRLLASNASSAALRSVLSSREEYREALGGQPRRVDNDDVFPLSGLFRGYPKFSGDVQPFHVVAGGGCKAMHLTVATQWLLEERMNGMVVRHHVIPNNALSGAVGAVLGVVIDVNGTQRILGGEALQRYLEPSLGAPPEASHLPCMFVKPFEAEHTAAFGALWDKAALANKEAAVLEALRIVAPDISGVLMVNEMYPGRTAFVRTSAFPEPVPLRSFGDGLTRVFGIALALVNAQKGLLLIDEFENGMHYSVQTDIWRIIFRLARELDVQVLATTHSNDAIAAFQLVANETGEDGVLVNLRREDDNIYSTVFSKEELAIATLNQIEVR